jgi:hypothetical protein
MKKFKCDLEGKLNIKFEDEEKVLKYQRKLLRN